MAFRLALTFVLASRAFACDLCNGPPRSVGDVDLGESVLELTLDSLESVVEVHSLVVLMLYDDRTAARQRLQSFAMAAAALKELETGDELETGESVVLGVIDVSSYAEVAHRLEVRRMPHASHTPRPGGAVSTEPVPPITPVPSARRRCRVPHCLPCACCGVTRALATSFQALVLGQAVAWRLWRRSS